MFGDIGMIFYIEFNHDKLKIKFKFCFGPMIFAELWSFFYILRGIELKLCVWLCNDESLIKFKFRLISSNFERVMPFFGL